MTYFKTNITEIDFTHNLGLKTLSNKIDIYITVIKK